LEDVCCDPEHIVKAIKKLDEEWRKVLVVYTNDLENSVENFKTNIVIASFVTMYGRIKLYKLLALIDEQPDCELVYFDTVKNELFIFIFNIF
jgi:hypothetical protein